MKQTVQEPTITTPIPSVDNASKSAFVGSGEIRHTSGEINKKRTEELNMLLDKHMKKDGI